jgi:hypothetical protein
MRVVPPAGGRRKGSSRGFAMSNDSFVRAAN